MSNNKYNRKYYVSLKKILYSHNNEKAEKFLREYLELFPDDKRAKLLYVQSLLNTNQLSLASNVINSFDTNDDIVKNYVFYYLKAKILCCYEKYDEILELPERLVGNNHVNDLFCSFYDDIRLLAMKETGILDNIDCTRYTHRQIFNYDSNETINHVIKHSSKDYCFDNDEFVFLDNINIIDLFNILRDNIDLEMRNVDTFFGDYYIFKLLNCGINKDGFVSNYIKLYAIPNTMNILTFFPYSDSSVFRFNNIIELGNQDKFLKSNVKRLSQIEKFNLKYHNNN